MAKSGPGRTPSKLLQLRGSWLADTRGEEPQPPEGKIKCPDELNADSLKIWREVAPVVEHMGLLTTADIGTFARYCELRAKWNGLDDVGTPAALGLADRLLRLEERFGLTPSARAGLAKDIKTKDKKAGKGRFFDKAG